MPPSGHYLPLALFASLALTACATRAERTATEQAALRQQAAQEIDRICALPEAERQADIRKIKEESGLELQCAER